MPYSKKKMSSALTTDDPVVAQVYEQCKFWSEGESPSISSITPFVMQLISVTQSIVTEKGKGAYKKQVVLTVLRKILENDVQFGSEDDERTIMMILETTVPGIIDTAVGIATGEIDLAKHAQQIGAACNCCC